MKLKIKSGISLIVLLITVLVMAILLTTVVLSIKDQHMTDSAYEAVIKEKIESYRIDIDDYVSKQELEQGFSYNKELLNADKNSITYDSNKIDGNIFSILNSMTAEDSEMFKIENGKLIYLPDFQTDTFSKEAFEISCRSGLVSYVPNGLVGYYEAINNVGGSQNKNAISWKDLSLNNNDAKISKKNIDAFTAETFKTDGESISAKFDIKLPEKSDFSIEIVYKNLDDSTKLLVLNDSIELESLGKKDKLYRTVYVYNANYDSIRVYNISNSLQKTVNNVGIKNSNLNSIEIPKDANKEYYSIRVYNKNILENDTENTRNLGIDLKRFENIN